MEGVIPSLLHEMSEKVTVQSLYKGNGVAARSGFSRYQCKRERFKLHEVMRRPFEKDDELTTLRSRGSRVEHNFCILSIFTASTITLSPHPQCQIHNHRAQNSQKKREIVRFRRDSRMIIQRGCRSPSSWPFSPVSQESWKEEKKVQSCMDYCTIHINTPVAAGSNMGFQLQRSRYCCPQPWENKENWSSIMTDSEREK